RRLLHDTVAKREAQLENALQVYERSRRLYGEGLISRADMERDQTAHEVTHKELSEARGQLRVLDERTERTGKVRRREGEMAETELATLRRGPRKESIRSVAAEVHELEEKLKILSHTLEQLEVR